MLTVEDLFRKYQRGTPTEADKIYWSGRFGPSVDEFEEQQFLRQLEQQVTDSGGAGQSSTSGASSVGQGVSNAATSLGLSLMGMPSMGLTGMALNALGRAIAGQQADAMGRAASALSDIQANAIPGVSAVSDRSGNVFGYSSPATVAAADAAMFGTSLSPAQEAAATSMADIAESGAAGAGPSGMTGGPDGADIGPGFSFAEGGPVRMQDGGAAFGVYPSSGRRPERLNQSRDVNAPLQLLRGWTAGLLGLPGDVEGLVRMLPGIQNETPVLPTSDFYREYLPGYDPRPAATALSGLGALTGGVGATRVAREGLGAVKRATDVNAIRNYIRSAQGVSGMPGTAVVKPKGGNWLSGATSPEQMAGQLKTTIVGQTPAERIPLHEALLQDPSLNADQLDRVRYHLDLARREDAVSRWLDQKLAKYIRNEMGTPEDPVRALAERGITHMQNAPEVDATAWTRTARREAGFPKEGMAQSQLARSWENLTDEMIAAQSAGRLRGAMAEYEGAKMTSDIHAGIDRNLVKERVRQLEDAFKDTPSKDLADEFNLNYEVTDANRSQAIKDWAESEVKGYFRGNEEDMLGPQYAHKIGLEAREAARQGQGLSWLAKVPEDQPVYSLMKQEDVGLNPEFGHLVDELRNATRADSDLPRELRLRPEQLSKVTMPQAVELVDKINKWRASQAAEANLAKARNPATFTVKEYPDQKMQWVELRSPEFKAEDALADMTESERSWFQRYLDKGDSPEEAFKGAVGNRLPMPGQKALEDALEYEGKVMGHCVGGYCPEVAEGRSKIYSLRDAKGEPHVTIEVKLKDWAETWESLPFDKLKAVLNAAGENADDEQLIQTFLQLFPEDAWRYQDEIVQIKGKGNRAPKKDYLPMVQDFVRSGNWNWNSVGDLSNTGLIPIDPKSDLAVRIKAAGGEPPKFVTQDELTELLRQNADPAKGFATGGLVSAYDPDRIAEMAAQLEEEMYA